MGISTNALPVPSRLFTHSLLLHHFLPRTNFHSRKNAATLLEFYTPAVISFCHCLLEF